MHCTYSKFANFHIIDTEDFLFFAGAQLEDGEEFADEIQAGEYEAGSYERVGAAGEGVGDLVANLDPVAVEPSAFDDGVAVEMCNVIASKELV